MGDIAYPEPFAHQVALLISVEPYSIRKSSKVTRRRRANIIIDLRGARPLILVASLTLINTDLKVVVNL